MARRDPIPKPLPPVEGAITEDDVVDLERWADRANDDGDNEGKYTTGGGL